ncbi:MAG TPA: heme exporter protein CcmB [Terriglobia bacterium]|nr:heme exporter protein CcmB [Terriglobia bacterium]
MKSMSAIIFKDIVIEMRNKESITSMLMFGVLVLVVFQFAFETTNVERELLAPGTLWVAFSFAAILGLNRSLAMETDNDCLQGLLLAPISRGDLYLGKVASNFIFMMIAEVIVLPLFVVFNNLDFNVKLLEVAGIACLGTLGIASVGTILSTISANTRIKEVMLPVLQIPLTVPVVIASVEATREVLTGDTRGISSWLYVLAGFIIVYLTASYLVFEFAVEE